MKKALIITFLILCSNKINFAASPTLVELRSLFEKSTREEKYCLELIQLLEPFDEDSPLLYGYKGSAKVLMAEHRFNPLTKLSYFNEGTQILEKAILRAPQNVELRFLRYSIQSNAPFFLNYDVNLEMDKQFLKEKLPDIEDKHLQNIITVYLKKFP